MFNFAGSNIIDFEIKKNYIKFKFKCNYSFGKLLFDTFIYNRNTLFSNNRILLESIEEN